MPRGTRVRSMEDHLPLGPGNAKLSRTTVFLTSTLIQNLDALALQTGEAKGVILRKALAEYLKKQGLQPYSRPRVSVAYGS